MRYRTGRAAQCIHDRRWAGCDGRGGLYRRAAVDSLGTTCGCWRRCWRDPCAGTERWMWLDAMLDGAAVDGTTWMLACGPTLHARRHSAAPHARQGSGSGGGDTRAALRAEKCIARDTVRRQSGIRARWVRLPAVRGYGRCFAGNAPQFRARSNLPQSRTRRGVRRPLVVEGIAVFPPKELGEATPFGKCRAAKTRSGPSRSSTGWCMAGGRALAPLRQSPSPFLLVRFTRSCIPTRPSGFGVGPRSGVAQQLLHRTQYHFGLSRATLA